MWIPGIFSSCKMLPMMSVQAVFVPTAFMAGISGQFFKQFALTIAVSTVISAFNSLTLSPALAALLLQPKGAHKDHFGRLLDMVLGWFFRAFNWTFAKATGGYIRTVSLALRGSLVVLVIYGGLLALTWGLFSKLPRGIAESLAKLAGRVTQDAATNTAPPPPDDTGGKPPQSG